MEKVYYRITYEEIGIYEALKKQIWSNSQFPKEQWEKFKNSNDVNWLKTPNSYAYDNYSYFTELGFTLFMKKTYPIIIKWLDESKIRIEKVFFKESEINLVYRDEHQIIIIK